MKKLINKLNYDVITDNELIEKINELKQYKEYPVTKAQYELIQTVVKENNMTDLEAYYFKLQLIDQIEKRKKEDV